jgi:hypothetical protein
MNTRSNVTDQTAPPSSLPGDRTRANAEFYELCESLNQKVIAGAMPPDDAYWWTRIALCEAGAPDAVRDR